MASVEDPAPPASVELENPETTIVFSAPKTPRAKRDISDYDEGDFTAPNFVDHFSTRRPSSTVKFRGARVHVYEAGDEQILLEDRLSNYFGGKIDYDDNGKKRPRRHNITVKRMNMTTPGLLFLRMAYTLIAMLLFSYTFAFCFQIVLFLFFNLYADTRIEAAGDLITRLRIVSTILSIPTFVIGFSSVMSIATTFVSEAWTGGHLIRTVIGLSGTIQELIYFVFFLLAPVITFISALFARLDDPWKLTCQTWICSIASIFIIFVFAITYREVKACFRLTSVHCGEISGVSGWKSFFLQTKRAIFMVQTLRYSGHRREQYLVTADDIAPKDGYTCSDKYTPTCVQQSWYSSITELGLFKCIFKTAKKRIYGVDEVREMLPFITEHSWSLDKMFCSNDRNRRVIAAKGPGSVKPSQVMSSFLCNVLGTVIITMLVVGYFYWLSAGVNTYIFIALLSVIFCLYPLIRSNLRILKMYTDLNKIELSNAEDTDEDDKDEETMYRLWETTRVSQPRAWACYTMMVLECLFLFIIPTVALFLAGNFPVAVVFFVLSVFGGIRTNFDSAALLCELGTLNDVVIQKPKPSRRNNIFARTSKYEGDKKTLVIKARLAEIIGNISKSDSVTNWIWFFVIFILVAFLLFGWAVTSDDGLGEKPPIVFVDDYEYIAENSLQYPTCTLNKGFSATVDETGEELDANLADASFLTTLTYETPNVTSYYLSQWFGEGTVVDEDELVKNFRAEENNDVVPIYFKFFSFPRIPDAGVIAIRGSTTGTDWLNNIQIWSASALAQLLKWLTPFGWIWTPVLDTLVWIIGTVQSQQLEDVSYYKVTTAFLNKFKDTYPSIGLVGFSLGGGLAMISGAQTRTRTIAFSGPGAEFARHTVVPPITLDDINKYTFNFIPDRDIIARIGGRPRLHQEGQCEAPLTSPTNCHSYFRTLCEISYRCGSNGKPVLCACHFQLGYPEPEPIGNTTRSFREACIESQQAFLNATGSKISVEYL